MDKGLIQRSENEWRYVDKVYPENYQVFFASCYDSSEFYEVFF